MVKIPLPLWTEIVGLLDGLLRHVTRGGVGSYSKVSKLVWNLYKIGAFNQVNMRSFGLINSVIKDFSRIERIEDGR